jgi:hypothetical protein
MSDRKSNQSSGNSRILLLGSNAVRSTQVLGVLTARMDDDAVEVAWFFREPTTISRLGTVYSEYGVLSIGPKPLTLYPYPYFILDCRLLVASSTVVFFNI